MRELAFRPYQNARDADAVRALFRSNAPRYFVMEEEPDFWRYVRSGEPYYVAVRIETSRLTAPFYATLGFAVLKTQSDGIAPGIDLVRMERPALL